MSTARIGDIKMFAGNFAPLAWAFCHGQLMSISQNTALYSILGTTYGGDGINTFALPDLRGRVPVGTGNGPGLTPQVLGQVSGSEATTLTVANLPAHSHTLNAKAGGGNQAGPAGHFLAASDQRNSQYTSAAADTTLAATAIGNAGNNTAHSNMQPSLGLSFIICLFGVYPARN
jgi:microcystin-dependent protein